MGKNLILIAQITSVHGVRGLVKLRSFADNPADVFSYAPITDENGTRVFEMEKRGLDKENFLVAVKGVETRDAANALRGTNLYINRSTLPPLQKGYYHTDLIGLNVVDKNDAKIGNIKAIHNFGSGDILEIGTNEKKSFMLLFNDINVPHVDLDTKTMMIDPPVEI